MNDVLRLCLVVVFSCTFVPLPSASAKQLIDENQKNTLRGLEQVRLVVNIGLSLEGPTKKRFWKEIEEQLKGIPIRVLPEESDESNSLPALFVDIAVLKTDRRTFFFLATARLYQQVLLNRDANISGPGITWRSWVIGEGNIENIRQKVRTVMDRFMSDYRTVNSSKRVEKNGNPKENGSKGLTFRI